MVQGDEAGLARNLGQIRDFGRAQRSGFHPGAHRHGAAGAVLKPRHNKTRGSENKTEQSASTILGIESKSRMVPRIKMYKVVVWPCLATCNGQLVTATAEIQILGFRF